MEQRRQYEYERADSVNACLFAREFVSRDREHWWATETETRRSGTHLGARVRLLLEAPRGRVTLLGGQRVQLKLRVLGQVVIRGRHGRRKERRVERGARVDEARKGRGGGRHGE